MTTFISSKNLFKGIEQPQNDLIFLRTFNALLASLILDDDQKQPFLNMTNRKTIFNRGIAYLKKKKTFAVLLVKRVGLIVLHTVTICWDQF